ncbi:MAG: hypothetical protein RLZZ09_1407, partial [Pseudomonadota bacterium]
MMNAYSPNPSRVSPLIPVTPGKAGRALVWRGLSGCGDALALAQAIRRDQCLYLVVTEDTQTAVRLEHEIRFFLGGASSVLHFPDWETLPYDTFSPLPEIVSERLKTLAELSNTTHGVLLTPVASLMQRLSPRTHVLGNTFILKPGTRVSLEETRLCLESVSYHCVTQVLQHGEFAIRGSILDLFPMGSHVPYRIELFDDEVESIRIFDPETQRSSEKVAEVNLFPAREFPFDDDAIKRFRQAFRSEFPEISSNNSLYQQVSKGVAAGGVDYYFPLFVEKTETLFDYLPAKTTVVLHGQVEKAAGQFFTDTRARYEHRLNYLDRPPLPPERLFLAPGQLDERLHGKPLILLEQDHASEEGGATTTIEYGCQPLPSLALNVRQKEPAEALTSLLREQAERTLFVAETAGHREALLEVLGRQHIKPKVIESWAQFMESAEPVCLVIAPMDHGLWMTDPNLAIVTESQLSGEKVQQRRRRRSSTGHKIDQILRNLEELEMHAPVVHQ